VDVTGVTLPVTKHNVLVTRASDLAPALREAFAVARAGRPGPVLVDITKDAQQASAPFDWEAAAPTRHRRHAAPEPKGPDLEAASRLLASARRPLILAGRGIELSGAREAVLAFAEIYAQGAEFITDELAADIQSHFGDAGLVCLIEALGFIDARIRLALLFNRLRLAP